MEESVGVTVKTTEISEEVADALGFPRRASLKLIVNHLNNMRKELHKLREEKEKARQLQQQQPKEDALNALEYALAFHLAEAPPSLTNEPDLISFVVRVTKTLSSEEAVDRATRLANAIRASRS